MGEVVALGQCEEVEVRSEMSLRCGVWRRRRGCWALFNVQAGAGSLRTGSVVVICLFLTKIEVEGGWAEDGHRIQKIKLHQILGLARVTRDLTSSPRRTRHHFLDIPYSIPTMRPLGRPAPLYGLATRRTVAPGFSSRRLQARLDGFPASRHQGLLRLNARHAATQAGDDKTGHIEAGPNESIVFVDRM